MSTMMDVCKLHASPTFQREASARIVLSRRWSHHSRYCSWQRRLHSTAKSSRKNKANISSAKLSRDLFVVIVLTMKKTSAVHSTKKKWKKTNRPILIQTDESLKTKDPKTVKHTYFWCSTVGSMSETGLLRKRYTVCVQREGGGCPLTLKCAKVA